MKKITFAEFINKFEDAAKQDTHVFYEIRNPRYHVEGGSISTLSYRDNGDSVELDTEDFDTTITLNKNNEIIENSVDYSTEYIFGDLELIMI